MSLKTSTLRRLIAFIFLFFYLNPIYFASDSLSVFKKRKLILGINSVAITSGSLIYLNQVWYNQYHTSNFHYFNDNAEWYKLDKCGHMLTTYQTGRLMMDAMKWAGYSKKNTLLIGGLSGFTYMAAIEVMDGYSNGWGFSWGDIGANSLGSCLVIGQKILWDEQRIQLKFSFLPSSYASYNPNLLGSSLSNQLLKDYNGQTYWLSINPSTFITRNNKFPKWLNIAIGYGANGMLGAKDNNAVLVDKDGNSILIKRYQQSYFSLDVDFTRIKTKSKVLKTIYNFINIVKVPFPNLELSEGKLKFNYY